MSEPGFVEDIALVLGVAGVTGLIFQRLKQPSILGYLFAGLIVGPYLPVPLFADPHRVHSLSEFGVILVMFAVGLEFRLEKFLSVLPVSGATGLVEIGAMLAAGYLLGTAMGWSELRSLFLGACICISSTMAVSKILEQRPVPAESKQLIYGVLVLQDVAAIALIAVMTAVAQGEQASAWEVLTILGKLSAALLGIVVVGMFFVPRLVRVLEKTKSKEVLAVGSIGICFSFAMLARAVGYSTALGAFIGGVLVAESGLGHYIEKSTASLRDVFVAVFFVSIGMSVDPLLAWKTLPTSLMVVGVVISVQLFSVCLAGTASGNGLSRSITAGLALGQIGEFAFIIGAIGVSKWILKAEFQSILVTVAVLSTFTTSLFLRFREGILKGVHRILPESIARVLVLYESWWQRLRQPSDEQRSGVRRIVAGLTLDLFVVAALILSWQAWQSEIGAYLSRAFHVGEELSQSLSIVALGVSLIPLLVPLILGARAVARKLATRLSVSERSSAHAFLTMAIGILIVSAFGIPGTFLIGRAVGTFYVWPAFFLALLLAGWVLWRRIGSLDTDMKSGGLLMLQAIADQGYSDTTPEHRPTLPGLPSLRPLQLTEGNYAVGKTLAEIALRTATEASVVALTTSSGNTAIPTGSETLKAGDLLYLSGTVEAQSAARDLLLEGKRPPEAFESDDD